MGPTIQSRTEDHLAIERLIFQYGMAIDDLDSVAKKTANGSNSTSTSDTTTN